MVFYCADVDMLPFFQIDPQPCVLLTTLSGQQELFQTCRHHINKQKLSGTHSKSFVGLSSRADSYMECYVHKDDVTTDQIPLIQSMQRQLGGMKMHWWEMNLAI